MQVDLVSLPSQLQEHHLRGRSVVIFDVLRATTSIVTAIASGAAEIQVFGSLEAALEAGKAFAGSKYLCGERQCLRPQGFDLGNSPGDFASPGIEGRTLFMSTTNGTRAIVAAAGAEKRLVAALVNATATAKCVLGAGSDVTLLCAGTDGQVAPEDLIGAGAVADALARLRPVSLESQAMEARRLFASARGSLRAVLGATAGGQNIVRAGLDADIDFAARLDVFDIVAEACGESPVVRRIIGSCQSEQK